MELWRLTGLWVDMGRRLRHALLHGEARLWLLDVAIITWPDETRSQVIMPMASW